MASHFVLDAIPHWGDWGTKRRFQREAWRRGYVEVLAAGALAPAALIALRGSRVPA